MTSCARSSETVESQPRARKNESSCGVKAKNKLVNDSSSGAERNLLMIAASGIDLASMPATGVIWSALCAELAIGHPGVH